MQLMIEWVTQIVLFIIIGTIVELLIPNNKLKQYIQIVIGLLLLLLLAKPLLFLFTTNIDDTLARIDAAIFHETEMMKQSEKMLEKQKEEIELEQAAYILEEAKKQLTEEANDILLHAFDVQVVDLTFYPESLQTDDTATLEKIIVHMSNVHVNETDDVTPIVIDATKTTTTFMKKGEKELDEKIEATLRNVWEIDYVEIELNWEGEDVD